MANNFLLLKFLNDISNSSPIIGGISSFISGWFTFIIFPVFFCYYTFSHVSQKMYFFSLTFSTLLTTWIFAEGIKRILKIPRPFVTHDTINSLASATGYSFPSEHSAVYSALAFIAFSVDIRLGIITSIVALVIGITRINLGVHYPIDVLVGWIIGILIAFVFTYFFKTYLW